MPQNTVILQDMIMTVTMSVPYLAEVCHFVASLSALLKFITKESRVFSFPLQPRLSRERIELHRYGLF